MENFNPFTLTGKRVLVTGASSGIGRGVSVACARMGATVIVSGRNAERLQATFGLLPDGEHRALVADLTKADNISRLVDELPPLDGIVHCAGVGSRVPCRDIQHEHIVEVMAPNFEGPILLQSAILAKRRLSKAASIVFIASRAAESPSPGNALYSASKGALLAYAKCLALELAPRKIRVNSICPGMVRTPLLTDTLDEETLAVAEQHYPLKRFGRVEDVANLAVYLLSDAAAWMTGSAIDISGGGEGVLK